MSGSFVSDITDSLTDLGEDAAAALPEGIPQIPTVVDQAEQEAAATDISLPDLVARIEDVSDLPFALEVADILANLDFGLDVNRLEGLIDRLPPDQRGPDATGEAATGLSVFTRAELVAGASLSAVVRVLDALGPDAYAVSTPGTYFTVIARYEDNDSGFSAARLRPFDGGPWTSAGSRCAPPPSTRWSRMRARAIWRMVAPSSSSDRASVAPWHRQRRMRRRRHCWPAGCRWRPARCGW